MKEINPLKIILTGIIITMCAFIIIDFCRIFSYQMKLDNLVPEVIGYYEDGISTKEIADKIGKNLEGTQVYIEEETNFIEYRFEYRVKLVTPGINMIFKDGYRLNRKTVINR